MKKTESTTYDVTLLEGSPYARLVARNDKPLSIKEQHLEEEKLQKSIVERGHESKEQHDRRVADWERKQQKQRDGRPNSARNMHARQNEHQRVKRERQQSGDQHRNQNRFQKVDQPNRRGRRRSGRSISV